MTNNRNADTVLRMSAFLRTCDVCGTEFHGRADAAYCSPACRQKAYRRRQSAQTPEPAPNTTPLTREQEEWRYLSALQSELSVRSVGNANGDLLSPDGRVRLSKILLDSFLYNSDDAALFNAIAQIEEVLNERFKE